MPNHPAARSDDPHAEGRALASPWWIALRALGIAALLIASLFVVIGFLLLPVAPV